MPELTGTIEQPTDELARGSHHVTFADGRATIHGLELFSGFDEQFDSGRPKNDQIRKWDADKVRSLASNTQRLIEERKSHPQIIVRHTPHEDNGDVTVEWDAVGFVRRVWYEERSGVPYVMGDVEMPEGEFQNLIMSNRFPRRSAQIWFDDMELSEVALLGRETPNRPLPDTHFSRTGKCVYFSRTVPEMHVHPGPTSTFIPGVTDMAGEDPKDRDDEKYEDDDDRQDNADTSKDDDDEVTKLKKQVAELKEQLKSAKQEKNEREDNARKVASERDDYQRQLDQIKSDLESERHARRETEARSKVDAMRNEGYRIDNEKAKTIVADLVSNGDKMDEKVEFYRSIVARDPLNHRVVEDHSRIDIAKGGGEAAEEKMAEVARNARVHANGDPKKFEQYMRENAPSQSGLAN